MSRQAESTPLPAKVVHRALLLFLIVLTPGCVTEFLVGDDVTTRNVACAVITLDSSREFSIEVHRVDSALDLTAGIETWRRHMESALEHEVQMRVYVSPGPSHQGPWTAEALAPWIEEQTILRNDEVRIHILLVPELSDEETVRNVHPGVIAINASAIQSAGEAGMDSHTVRRALLFHGLGHTLGVVNRGIPMGQADVTGREDPQHHEPSARSVMHVGWHKVDTMPRTNATYDAYSAAIIEDWRMAKTGVCA